MNKDETIKDSKHKETEFQAMTHFDDPLIPYIYDIPSYGFGAETVRDMAMYIEFACTNKEIDLNDRQEIAKTLCVLGYRKIGEDEIVISNSEYKALRCAKYEKMYKDALEDAEKLEQAKKETATKILQIVDGKLDLYRNGVIGGTLYDDGYRNAVNEIKIAVKNKYGIDLEN